MNALMDKKRDLNKRVGLAVKMLRTLDGRSQDALAKDIGVTQGTISAIERGDTMSLSRLEAVARVLNYRLSDLVIMAESIGDTATVIKSAKAVLERTKR